jgi:hypothetical protein
MGKLSTSLGLATVVAAGSAAYLAYRISRETGKSFAQALGEVPAEAERYWEELRVRGSEAVQAGREAAREKQAEIDQELES